ncbi:DUF2059 domain-containing protein [Epilithonimonas sp. JDS]|uniref:SecDF P1 head subdomain-containing protein n=1 Tax=Epilithonimonas sp. JDS TaxID=2902797 RepID=UPI001E55155B|nr:DUF2059 domain-containing protein [Epilithonimonas sp. JDS]MCD9854783.1 DUF2059 domain-containing protein [Epilithonimonas sp. JDS]
MKNKIFPILLVLIYAFCFSQNTEQKTEYILKSNGTIEAYKLLLTEMGTNPLKYHQDKMDSLKLVKIENQLTDSEITKRLSKAFSEVFTNGEISEIYQFYKSSAGQKFFNSYGVLEQKFNESFQDVFNEFKPITEEMNMKSTLEPEKVKEDPVPTDRVDGFYSVVNYEGPSQKLKDFRLSSNPSITTNEILEVKKLKDEYGRPVIDIILNKEGAKKFRVLTENNIGKPIAIVFSKKILSAPFINDVINDGRVQIAGIFTEAETDKLIQDMKK